MKCILTDVSASSSCGWCNKKTDCVQASIEGTFFKHCFLCWKCLKKAIELRFKQAAQKQLPESNPKLEG